MKERRPEKIKHSDIKKRENKDKQKKSDFKKCTNKIIQMIEDNVEDEDFMEEFEKMSYKYKDKYSDLLIESIDSDLCEEVSKRIINMGLTGSNKNIDTKLYPSEYPDSQELYNACMEWLVGNLPRVSQHPVDSEIVKTVMDKMVELETTSILKSKEWSLLLIKLMEVLKNIDVYYMTHTDNNIVDFIIKKIILVIYLNLGYGNSIPINFIE